MIHYKKIINYINLITYNFMSIILFILSNLIVLLPVLN